MEWEWHEWKKNKMEWSQQKQYGVEVGWTELNGDIKNKMGW